MSDPLRASADALAAHANDLLRSGRTADARTQLDEAAAIHRSAGRAFDEARCAQLAATLYRLEGHFDEAKRRCARALALCPSNGLIAFPTWAELGEIGLTEGDGAEAVDAYSKALTVADADGVAEAGRAAVLRKRAVAFTARAEYLDAVRDLEAAHDLLIRAGDRPGAARTLIEQATALRHSGRAADAACIVRKAMDQALADDDHAALADLHLLLAAEALDHRDAAGAMASAQAARSEALAANAPTSYIGAAHTMAQLAETTGDRLTAYAALATGWATLRDLLGGDVARAAFEPKLSEMRERWGAQAFADVKKSYEARRRRGGTDPVGSAATS